ncbi:MAG TPA: hypothetical protein VJ183_12685 [Chloroflexia bacterium]|nr:hypothetical protein [Chloroflexia bacterium]
MNYYPWLENQQGASNSPVPTTMTQMAGGGFVNRGADAKPMDLGAQVAARRNLEFSAGQRSHRLSAGSYTRA